MRSIYHRGTSVLAALVFVAIFVLVISGAKLITPAPGSQSAAVASIGTEYVCKKGDVHRVDLSSTWEAQVTTRIDAAATGCVIEYCPPAQFTDEPGTCFVSQVCDASAGESMCMRGGIQNATQPEQAAGIIAAALIADRGKTSAQLPGGDSVFLTTQLTDAAISGVVTEIIATAEAARTDGVDETAINDLRAIADMVEEHDSPCGTDSIGCMPQVHVASVAAATLAAEARTTAQISCQPKIADAGMTIGIAFGCTNATRSEGSGFSTADAQWGATSAMIPDYLPNGMMTYSLTCEGPQETVTASCQVRVVKPVMLFTAQAAETADGAASLAWVTNGMRECALESFEQPGLTRAVLFDGVAQTAPITEETNITLRCTTDGGATKQTTATLLPSDD